MLLLDEMKIKEDIVYNKHTGDMVGFVNLGDINNTILDLQREMNGESHPPNCHSHASYNGVRSVQARISNSTFWNRQTQCCLTVSIWEAVRHLESSGFKVIGITADGASPNRKFFSMHKDEESQCTYKTTNPYAEDEER